jgi:hypothetical protein
MAELLLFHHAQGRTAGCLTFADELRRAGHIVHAPDLYDGRTFTELTAGVGYAEQVGFDTIIERGRLAADGLCVPASEFGRPWPQGVPLQIHTMEADEWGDLDDAHQPRRRSRARSCSCTPATGTCCRREPARPRRRRRDAAHATRTQLPRDDRVGAVARRRVPSASTIWC